MSVYVAVPLLTIAGLLQVTLLPNTKIGGATLGLVTVMVVCWGSLRGPHQGAIWGLIGGLVLDLLASTPFGVYTCMLILLGMVGAVGEFYLERSSPLRPLAVVFVGTLILNGFLFLLMQLSGAAGGWAVLLLEFAFPAAIVNTLFTPLIYWLLEALANQWEPKKDVAWWE